MGGALADAAGDCWRLTRCGGDGQSRQSGQAVAKNAGTDWWLLNVSDPELTQIFSESFWSESGPASGRAGAAPSQDG